MCPQCAPLRTSSLDGHPAFVDEKGFPTEDNGHLAFVKEKDCYNSGWTSFVAEKSFLKVVKVKAKVKMKSESGRESES